PQNVVPAPAPADAAATSEPNVLGRSSGGRRVEAAPPPREPPYERAKRLLVRVDRGGRRSVLGAPTEVPRGPVPVQVRRLPPSARTVRSFTLAGCRVASHRPPSEGRAGTNVQCFSKIGR